LLIGPDSTADDGVAKGRSEAGDDEEHGHRASDTQGDAAVRDAQVPGRVAKRVMQQHGRIDPSRVSPVTEVRRTSRMTGPVRLSVRDGLALGRG